MKFDNRFRRNCTHRRIKKNYLYGKKSTPTMKCKDCGKSIKPKDLESKRKYKKDIKNGKF